MTNQQALVAQGAQPEITAIERVLIGGDLATLKTEDRIAYYKAVCDSVGLNPLTKPFEYISLNGKLTLYALKACTDQLRNIHKLSIRVMAREVIGEVYVVTARAIAPTGREDESTGAVPLGNLKGEALANAYMKAETKAKRRVTLSICGLGMLDETEVSSIPSAKPYDPATDELVADAAKINTSGAPIGTKEAAQAVAQRKLTEIEPEGKPIPEGVKALILELNGMGKFERIKKISSFKQLVGENEYYRVLNKYGVDHSDKIPTIGKMRQIAWDLWESQQVLNNIVGEPHVERFTGPNWPYEEQLKGKNRIFWNDVEYTSEDGVNWSKA